MAHAPLTAIISNLAWNVPK